MADLSIIIPARNEEFLGRTIEDILENIEGDTEIIAICDGYWPDPPIADNPRVHLIHHEVSIGQRAATNEGARFSNAKYIMKCDAHCAFDKGFDVKLMENCKYDWTVTPTMYNLHAFDWECQVCGNKTYQGPEPTACECKDSTEFKKIITWEPKHNPRSQFYRFDTDLRFKYWRDYKNRPEAKGDIVDVMGNLGACIFWHRERFWDLGGLDEDHGSWGQLGTEISCKAWLSGGRQVTNTTTWFAHMFRTGGGFGFPYKHEKGQVPRARKRSRELWLGNKWPLAKHDLKWLIDKFAPVPDWEEAEGQALLGRKVPSRENLTRGLVYYTDNRCEERILHVVRKQLDRARNGHKLVTVSQYPINFGDSNIVMPLERSHLSMFKQMLRGLEEVQTDIVFFVEHDVLYHPSHFDFIPPKKDVYYYNDNIWKLNSETGQALHYMEMKQVSGLVAYRELLLEHYRNRIKRVEAEGFTRRIGYEPGKKLPRGIDNHPYAYFTSEKPNIDIKHPTTLTSGRFKLSQYRCRERIKDSWVLADEIPSWGKTKGRVDAFLREVMDGS